MLTVYFQLKEDLGIEVLAICQILLKYLQPVAKVEAQGPVSGTGVSLAILQCFSLYENYKK